MTNNNYSQLILLGSAKPIKTIMIGLLVLATAGYALMFAETAQGKDESENNTKYTDKYGIIFVRIPAGSFRMGDIQGGGSSYEKPVHKVTIARPFYMSKTEITQAQWRAVMGDNPSSYKGDKHPVENVNWDEIQFFISRINQLTGKTYRLPSEAEWEYAARAGSRTKYSWGNTITRYHANYGGLSKVKRWGATSPVGSFSPNAFGLYDMHGNVYEWTQDCVNKSYNGAPTDGSTWLSGDCTRRVLRGGSWSSRPRWLRSAYRFRDTTSLRSSNSGFRLIQDNR